MELEGDSCASLRRWVSSDSAWELEYGYARAVRSKNLIFVSGTTAVMPDGRVVGENDVYQQACHIFLIIAEALKELEASMKDVVRTRMYVVDIRAHADAVGKAHSEVFDTIRPAATMVGVAGLIAPELLVEIEVDAVLTTSP